MYTEYCWCMNTADDQKADGDHEAWVNPDSGKVHRMGSWWETDEGVITPSGTGCGALLWGYSQVALSTTAIADRCKVCWPLRLRAAPPPPRLGVIHLRAVLAPEIPVCRGEIGPSDRLGEEREGDCPECLAIRSGRGVRIYMGGRRVQ
jgi:hypothetical protein